MEIILVYTSIDRCYVRRKFKTLAGAQGFAWKMVGETPEIGHVFQYAVSDDGIGKIEIRSGATLQEIFPRSAGL